MTIDLGVSVSLSLSGPQAKTTTHPNSQRLFITHKLTNRRWWRSKPLENHLKPPACLNTPSTFFISLLAHSLPLPVSLCQPHSQRNKYIWAYFQPLGRLMHLLKASVAKEAQFFKLSLLLSRFVSCSLQSTQHAAPSLLLTRKKFSRNYYKNFQEKLVEVRRKWQKPLYTKLCLLR